MSGLGSRAYGADLRALLGAVLVVTGARAQVVRQEAIWQQESLNHSWDVSPWEA